MVNVLFIELVGCEVFFTALEKKMLYGDKGKEKALSFAVTAVAAERFNNVACNFKCDCPTMTASFICIHVL
jgi:hypothetical protein